MANLSRNVVVGICCMVLFDPGVAASVIASDVMFEDTVAHSDLVAVGLVGKSLGVEWRGSVHRLVYTKYEFVISDVLSGESPPGKTITLLMLGGTFFDERYQQEIESRPEGALRVDTGERLLACLSRVAEGVYEFAGLAHGKYLVHPDKDQTESITIETRLASSKSEDATTAAKPQSVELTINELEIFIRDLKSMANQRQRDLPNRRDP